jgi:hypothetical protein
MHELYVRWTGRSEMVPHKWYRTLQAAWMAFHRMRQAHDYAACEIRDEKGETVARWSK